MFACPTINLDPMGPRMAAAFLSRGRSLQPLASYQILGELKWSLRLQEECCQSACFLPRIRMCAPLSGVNTSHVPDELQRAFKSKSSCWLWASLQCPNWEPLGGVW